MSEVFEFNMADPPDKKSMEICFNSCTHMVLTLKNFGYTDDDVYEIIGLLLSIDCQPTGELVEKIDGLLKGIREFGDGEDAESFKGYLRRIKGIDTPE